MNAPVITLKGACKSAAPAAAKSGAASATKAAGTANKGCVSTLTRAQFEALTSALQPADKGPIPPEIRRKFATQYSKLLVFADAARELGLQNDARVEQIVSFARNQILAEELNQHYMEKYAHPSDAQLQQYYDQNKKKYVEATLQRIIIPAQQQTAPAAQGASDKAKPTPEEQKAFADKVRSRWSAGEDPVALQKEAMERSEFKSSPPDVNMGARKAGTLPEAHEGVFEMKPGEISQVYADPAAFYIYKVVSVRQIPLSEVKQQVEQTLQRQQFTEKIDAIQKSVTPELNDAYFGPDVPPSVPQGILRPGMPGQRGPMAAPPGAPAPGGPAPTAPNPPSPANPGTTPPPSNSGPASK